MKIPLIVFALISFAEKSFCDWEWVTKTGNHTGAFVRLGLWGTPGSSSETTLANGDNESLDNVGSMARLQIGWSVIPRVIVHANIVDVLVPLDNGFSALTWGPGVTAYSSTGNFFITGVYGYSVLNMDGDKSGTGSQWYIGVGKEFQISQCNGIGIMATWESGSWKDEDSQQSWKESGPGFQFTWTYN